MAEQQCMDCTDALSHGAAALRRKPRLGQSLPHASLHELEPERFLGPARNDMTKAFVASGLLLVLGCLLAGCKNDTHYYYERMKALEQKIKENPSDEKPWTELKDYTRSSDFWNRSYAYESMVVLAMAHVPQHEAELIKILRSGLNNDETDPDKYEIIKSTCASGIGQAGGVYVRESLPELIAIVQAGIECDYTWYSAEALGQLDDPVNAERVFNILLTAAGKPVPAGTEDGAPLLRDDALNAAAEIAKRNAIKDSIPKFEELALKVDPKFRERVLDQIAYLKEP